MSFAVRGGSGGASCSPFLPARLHWPLYFFHLCMSLHWWSLSFIDKEGTWYVTLFISESKWSKDKALILTMVPIWQRNKFELKKKRRPRKTNHVSRFWNNSNRVSDGYFEVLKLFYDYIIILSEVVSLLLVIQIQIQAVWCITLSLPK